MGNSSRHIAFIDMFYSFLTKLREKKAFSVEETKRSRMIFHYWRIVSARKAIKIASTQNEDKISQNGEE